MACTTKSLLFALIVVLTIYSLVTLAFLIQYSNYELENDIIVGYNNGLPTIIMNVFNLASLLFIIRALLQEVYAPPNINPDFQFIMGWIYIPAQIATFVSAFVSFGYNCHYTNACYTVVSPLYGLVLVYMHLIFLAVAISALLGLGCLCRIDYLIASDNQQQPAQYGSVSQVNKDIPATNYLKFKTVQNLYSRQKDTTCSICSIDYTEKDTVELLKNCSHYFHKECIDTWKKTKPDSTCPICRITIVTVKE